MANTPDPNRDLVFRITTADTVLSNDISLGETIGSEGGYVYSGDSPDVFQVEILLGELKAEESFTALMEPTLSMPSLVAEERTSVVTPLEITVSLAEQTAQEVSSAEVEAEGGITTRSMVFFGRYKVYNSDKLGEIALRKLAWLQQETR